MAQIITKLREDIPTKITHGMKTAGLIFSVFLISLSLSVKSQTARTVITLDGSSPERYSKSAEEEVESTALSELLSGIEEEFGSLDDPDNVAEISKKLDNLEKSDILTKVARINRKYYASLIEMGFTTDEAMKIILANPVVEFLKKEVETDAPKKSRTLTLELQ